MVPLADFFGIGAGEDLDDVVEADAEAGGVLDAVDAGEDFCATVVPS